MKWSAFLWVPVAELVHHVRVHICGSKLLSIMLSMSKFALELVMQNMRAYCSTAVMGRYFGRSARCNTRPRRAVKDWYRESSEPMVYASDRCIDCKEDFSLLVILERASYNKSQTHHLVMGWEYFFVQGAVLPHRSRGSELSGRVLGCGTHSTR